MQLWADLRAILPPDLASALAKCEQAAASPVDAMLVTGLSPEWMEAPPCTAFFGAPLAPDEPSAALLTPSGERVGLRVQASDPAGQAAAMSAVGSVNWVHLDATSEDEWTMIPAENVISVCHSTPTRLAATARPADEARASSDFTASQLRVGAHRRPRSGARIRSRAWSRCARALSARRRGGGGAVGGRRHRARPAGGARGAPRCGRRCGQRGGGASRRRGHVGGGLNPRASRVGPSARVQDASMARPAGGRGR